MEFLLAIPAGIILYLLIDLYFMGDESLLVIIFRG